MSAIKSGVTQRFRDEGFRDVQLIGSGMEGDVYRLEPGVIAKVWHKSSRERLVALQEFYRSILQVGLTIVTPQIFDVWQIGEHGVSIEKEIIGRTLESCQPLTSSVLPRAVSAVVDVLTEFWSVPPLDVFSSLPVLDEHEPFSSGGGWSASLAALTRRRVDLFHPVLNCRVTSLDKKVTAVLQQLEQRASIRSNGLIHGDLIPANIVVDDNLRPTAVLDFGFLSTYGDCAFDAAVTGSIFEMYGPNARSIEERLDQQLLPASGAATETFALYRAAYALITANAYDPDGADGHFQWCVDMLERPEVCGVLGVA